VDTLEGGVTSQVVTGAGAGRRDYTYNQAGQLTARSVNSVSDQSYFYDAKSGDLRCVTDSGYPASVCDGDGSAQPGLRDWYAFDPLDRLKTFKSHRAGKTADSSYVYDAFDRLSSDSQTHNGGPARTDAFTYLGASSQVSSETLSGGSFATKRYAYDVADNRIGATVTAGTTTDYTPGRNPHGDVSSLLDDSGAVAASYAYAPYGALDPSLSRGDVDQTNALNPFQFNDKRLDTGSGAIDMGARRYSADDGRFLQQDYFQDANKDFSLSDDPSTAGRYAFAGANPVLYAEDDGHSSRRQAREGWNTYPSCQSSTRRQREACALEFLNTRLHLKLAKAAAFVGNWDVESSYPRKPTCKGVDNRCWQGGCPPNSWANPSCGFGIAQWTFQSRKDDLVQYSGGTKRAKGLNPQLGFVQWELLTTFSSALGHVRAVRGNGPAAVRRATQKVRELYEIPDPSRAHDDRRKRNAIRVYNGYFGGKLY
jgi:RHS repeat-associated protein